MMVGGINNSDNFINKWCRWECVSKTTYLEKNSNDIFVNYLHENVQVKL